MDALRASGGSLIKNPYFRKLDRVCASAAAAGQGAPGSRPAAAVPAYLAGAQALSVGHDDEGRRDQAAPKRHARFHKRFSRLHRPRHVRSWPTR